jgi:hypothetical protein
MYQNNPLNMGGFLHLILFSPSTDNLNGSLPKNNLLQGVAFHGHMMIAFSRFTASFSISAQDYILPNKSSISMITTIRPIAPVGL